MFAAGPDGTNQVVNTAATAAAISSFLFFIACNLSLNNFEHNFAKTTNKIACFASNRKGKTPKIFRTNGPSAKHPLLLGWINLRKTLI